MGEEINSAVNKFTAFFYKNVAGKAENSNVNLVSSGLSVHVALSMIASTGGALGSTGQEMLKSLHLDKTASIIILNNYQQLVDSVNNLGEDKSSNVTVKLANKLYLSDRVEIKDEFKDATIKYFRSESSNLDLTKGPESAKAINDWCSDQTNGKIRELIRESDFKNLDTETALVLVNAVYFKADWLNKFDKGCTNLKSFKLNDKQKSSLQVPTMYVEAKFFHRELEDLDASYVVLPYANPDLYMLIVLPNKVDGLKKVEDNIDQVNSSISESREYMNMSHVQTEIKLSLPKFKVETTLNNLSSNLQDLGFKDIFTAKANLKGISDRPLKLGKVVQKAFIEVNEDGCEAAAATGLQITMMCMPPPPIKLDVDRPFLFNIYHKNTALFTGRILNPLA